jgi:hypothetical protein
MIRNQAIYQGLIEDIKNNVLRVGSQYTFAFSYDNITYVGI